MTTNYHYPEPLIPLQWSGFCQGGPQLLRLKVSNDTQWSHMNKATYLQPGSRSCFRAQEAFGFLMLKYICILPISRDSSFLSFDV